MSLRPHLSQVALQIDPTGSPDALFHWPQAEARHSPDHAWAPWSGPCPMPASGVQKRCRVPILARALLKARAAGAQRLWGPRRVQMGREERRQARLGPDLEGRGGFSSLEEVTFQKDRSVWARVWSHS